MDLELDLEHIVLKWHIMDVQVHWHIFDTLFDDNVKMGIAKKIRM